MPERSAWHPPYARQPWRSAYLAYQLLSTLFVRIPWWMICYVSPSNRQRPTWNFRRALIQRFVKHYMHTVLRVGPIIRYPDYAAIVEGPGVKGVWIAPAPELVTGELQEWAERAGVLPMCIPGYWIEKRESENRRVAPPIPGEKVLLAFHGGAYARQSAHPKDFTSNIPRGILQYSNVITRALTLEYRLTKALHTTPCNPFPAALLDAISGYNYLVNTLGFDPTDIILEGDSAGGNLALALVRYLVENQRRSDIQLPAPPGGIIFNSPWCDLSLSDDFPGSTLRVHQRTDYLNMLSLPYQQTIRSFLGPFGSSAALSNPYISPAARTVHMEKISFVGFPRTFITAGGCEVLLDQIRVLRDRMRRDMGTAEVVYLEMPEAVHDVLVFTWFEPERTLALQAIAAWIAAGQA